MKAIQLFFQTNKEWGFMIMVLCVVAITGIIKLIPKHFTKNITNDKAKKAINGTFFCIGIGAGFLVEYIYSKLIGKPFTVDLGVVFGAMGVTAYGAYEMVKRIVEYVIDKIIHRQPINMEEVAEIVTDEIVNKGKKKSKKVAEVNEIDNIMAEFDNNIQDNE